MNEKCPLVSVVTVSYNAVSIIEKTILSVISQTYDNIEYIIIDGGSTDGTLEIVKKYEKKISCWISEPDNGIYDAMNKGAQIANGTWLNFMNCGDTFYDENVVKNIFCSDIDFSNVLVLYGKTLIHNHYGYYIVTPPKISVIKNKMPFCHQSVFVTSAMQKQRPFNIKYKISADFDFFRSVYLSAPDSFKFYDGIVSNYDAISGISSVEELKKRGEGLCVTGTNYALFDRFKILLFTYFPGFLHLVLALYYKVNKRYTLVKK